MAPFNTLPTPPRTPEHSLLRTKSHGSTSEDQLQVQPEAATGPFKSQSYSLESPSSALGLKIICDARVAESQIDTPDSSVLSDVGAVQRLLPLEDVIQARPVQGQIEIRRDEDGREVILGRGGCGTVYEGSLELDEAALKSKHFIAANRNGQSPRRQVVALKQASDRDSQRALEREARTISYLLPERESSSRQAPFLADFFGYDAASSTLVLECLPLTLYDYSRSCVSHRVAGEPTVGSKQWLFFCRRMISCLDYLHSRAVVHGDIKPANILLRKMIDSTDPELTYEPVLCDFTSSVFEATTTGIDSPITGGTTEFTSPELMRRMRRDSDEASDTAKPTVKDDIYSLAVTLLTPALGDNVYSAAPNRFLRLDWIKQGRPLSYAPTVWSLKKKGVVDTVLRPALNAEEKRCGLSEWQSIVEKECSSRFC
jgi:serine/threonine protein kinase